MLASSPSIFDPISQWANFGVLGLFILAAIFGYIWFKPSVDRLKSEAEQANQRAEKAEEQRDHSTQIAQEKILPLLSEFVTTTSALLPLLQSLIEEWKREN